MVTKYKAILFDMDGTLLDTLTDLTDAVNYILNRHGYPKRTVDEVRSFVGNGARKLIERAVPAGLDAPTVDAVLAEYKDWYEAHNCVKTAPYAGIPAALAALEREGVKLAVVSNKPDGATKKLAARFFPGLPAFGQKDNIPAKPAPDMVWDALAALGVDRADGAYVGDSEVDVATAKNAGLALIAVDWGFRSREALLAAGAETVVSNATELLENVF